MPSATHPPPHSPSPPPSIPIAQTPGPRAQAFIKLYASALSSTIDSISYAAFAECFPLISTQAPEALRSIHGGMCKGLEGFGQDEFNTILEERNVIERLNALEERIADARRRSAQIQAPSTSTTNEIEPPHLLPPQRLLTAHLHSLHISQQSQLNAKLQTTQSRNAALMEVVRGQRGVIEGLLVRGEEMGRDVKEAGERVGIEGGRVSERVRGAEVVMGGF